MILLLAAGLSMDAFAISVTNGMCYRMPRMKNALYSGLAFGFFQGLMPFVGYLGGHAFSGVIENLDHWIALLLLGFIGARMIIGALQAGKGGEDTGRPRAFAFKMLILQAVATSIDALAVGISLGVIRVNIALAVCLIAATTFSLSFAGVFIGDRFGGLLKGKAELLGGAILVFIGVKIFIEHAGIL